MLHFFQCQMLALLCIPYIPLGACTTPLSNGIAPTCFSRRPSLQVVFYDQSGRELQVFDYSNDDSVREFCSCAFNPSGETAVFGAYNRFYIYSHNLSRGTWEQVSTSPADTGKHLV